MHARFLNVLHHAADDRVGSIAQTIHIDLRRILEKAIDQHRPVGAGLDRVAHVTAQILRRVNNLHGAATQNERRADQHRITDRLRHGERLVLIGGRPALGGTQTEAAKHRGEKLAILRHFDAGRRRANNFNPVGFERRREIQRCLASELHDNGVTLLPLVDVEHVFQSERFKVKFVARVVVGRNGFGVGVDHHRFPPEFLEGKGRMDAAVIELDPLSDAVGAAAQNHDALFRRGPRFVLVTIARIKIRRVSLELGRAGVDQTVSRHNPGGLACRPHGALVRAGQKGDLPVGKSVPLHPSPRNLGKVTRAFLLDRHHVGQAVEKPRVDAGQLMDPVHPPACD